MQIAIFHFHVSHAVFMAKSVFFTAFSRFRTANFFLEFHESMSEI